MLFEVVVPQDAILTRFFASLVLALLTTACTTGAKVADDIAAKQGFERVSVRGQDFRHVAFKKDSPESSSIVHVYVEGDGKPWIRSHLVAKDPTPGKPLMLNLMALDASPAIYLGRPCYFRYRQDSNCQNELWTSHRYSEQVVDSMTSALQKMLNANQSLVLLGHSGGGTIAMLMAARISQVKTVVTITGNLNTDAWSQLHGHTPLHGSLNPYRQPALSATIKQFHIAGGQDKNIPANLIKSAVMQQSNTKYLYFPEQSHNCCWEQFWPHILSKIN